MLLRKIFFYASKPVRYIIKLIDIERTSLFITDGNKTIAQIDNLDEKNTIRYQYDNHLGSASLELNEDGGFI